MIKLELFEYQVRNSEEAKVLEERMRVFLENCSITNESGIPVSHRGVRVRFEDYNWTRNEMGIAEVWVYIGSGSSIRLKEGKKATFIFADQQATHLSVENKDYGLFYRLNP